MDLYEWLGDNQLAHDIWQKKYQHNGETLDEFFDRVSGGNEDIKRLIQEKKFCFGGRILANRGLQNEGRKITYSNCFLAGTQVWTSTGYKNIEDVAIGDMVMTHDGTWKPVSNTLKRKYSGDIYRIDSIGIKKPIYCTPNHQFLTNGVWKSISEFHRGSSHQRVDRLVSVNYQHLDHDDRLIDITDDFVPTENRKVYFDESTDRVGISSYLFNNKNGKYNWRRPRENCMVNRHFVFDKDAAYFFGRWLGDGSVTPCCGRGNPSIIQIVFNATTERDAFVRCKEIGERIFGRAASCRETEQNTIALRFENEILGYWVYRNFGHTGDNKKVPEWAMHDFYLLLGLLDSDGSVHSNGIFKLLLKNDNLVRWARETLYENGINASPSIQETRQVASSFCIQCGQSSKLLPYLTRQYGDDRLTVREGLTTDISIKDLSNEFYESIDVYNLSVEDNQSYVVEGVVAHNCYVINPPEDNIESIYEVASKLARTYSYGGGCGVDISELAPKGARINNAAFETSGAVSFMNTYSQVTEQIGQNGRRGALMISLDCHHPDLEEFIDIKTDPTKVTKANISVRITDDFMRAVENDEEFDLEFYRYESDQHITKTVNAREVFMKLATNNWKMAEPGCLFWDRIRGWNIMSEYPNFEYAGVNPCFAGNMKLLTVDGYKTFEELCDTEFDIVNAVGSVSRSKVWCSGEKETVKVILTNDKYIECTPDHVFMTNDGSECEAKNLSKKRLMPFINCIEDYDDTFIKLGFIQGDGELSHLLKNGVIINLGKKDEDIKNVFLPDITHEYSNGRAVNVTGYNEILRELEFCFTALPERCFPNTYDGWNVKQKRSFLRGCYSANGSVINHSRVAYKTTCETFANQLLAALKEFDINGYITINNPSNITFENGTYLCKKSYDVNICQYDGLIKFAENIGFYHDYKTKALMELLRERAPFVMAVKPNGTKKVYDFTEPEIHWGVVENVVVHNCAEEPLPKGGSCLLGSLNLAEFVDEKEGFQWEEFKDAVGTAVVALNEVLEEGLPLHPLEEQRKSVSDWLQIGMGVMGLADALIKMKIRYGSVDSLAMCNQIANIMAKSAILQSCRLAEIKGAFPKYDAYSTLKSEFFRAHVDKPEIVARSGLRNSQLLTIPPTGSIANLFGVSGAIEPIYANSYTRKTESLHGKDTYYKVYTPIVEEYMKSHGITDEKDLPDYFVTAKELNYKERIDMQSVWQNHIDASISSTINLPNNITEDEVYDLYMYAWKKGLKGVTIYRDGCEREGILSEKDNDEFDEEELLDLPRGIIETVPEGLQYRKYKLITGCGQLYLFVGIDDYDNKIYDIYTATDSESGGGCAVNTTAVSRLISIGMRGGVPIEEIIKQLKGSGSCPSYLYAKGAGKNVSRGKSCASAIANVLQDILDELAEYDMWEKYELELADGDDVYDNENESTIEEKAAIAVIGETCPECGSPLNHTGGCVECIECGWTKCN